MNQYCMIKGTLLRAAPYKDTYIGSPHYVITISAGAQFNIVVNSASTQPGPNGSDDVYSYANLNFVNPITSTLGSLDPGLHTDGFPLLDYAPEKGLLDLSLLQPVPYEDENGNHVDINDNINSILTIDETQNSQSLPFDNGSGVLHDRDFWTPTQANVIVYGFGFLFVPQRNGLHETHMNQGNPPGKHAAENARSQDGAVIVQKGDGFTAIFTAFETQCLPTDAAGNPVPGAQPLPQYIQGR
ncbi:DUF2278 family protein [Paraburkholderia sp. CNPSo 3274]|uniref:DUF2278 family protein n=1 Tax=Paraburkholderia sp. CNPSo 3274 TaxID=2940932 RepID=UPI0020B85763|nr:DUF2278 family protein [Paraburkholderia sp. CNPSo 3274]MCP3713525.1 DUF2278 family protein [Paraburkholderia sp. CNPSo 3274]